MYKIRKGKGREVKGMEDKTRQNQKESSGSKTMAFSQ